MDYNEKKNNHWEIMSYINLILLNNGFWLILKLFRPFLLDNFSLQILIIGQFVKFGEFVQDFRWTIVEI